MRLKPPWVNILGADVRGAVWAQLGPNKGSNALQSAPGPLKKLGIQEAQAL